MADVESNNSQQATDQAGAGMADPKADPGKAITETPEGDSVCG